MEDSESESPSADRWRTEPTMRPLDRGCGRDRSRKQSEVSKFADRLGERARAERSEYTRMRRRELSGVDAVASPLGSVFTQRECRGVLLVEESRGVVVGHSAGEKRRREEHV